MRSWKWCRSSPSPQRFQRLEWALPERPDRYPETRRALPKRVAGFEFETKFLRLCPGQFPEPSISPDSIFLSPQVLVLPVFVPLIADSTCQPPVHGKNLRRQCARHLSTLKMAGFEAPFGGWFWAPNDTQTMCELLRKIKETGLTCTITLVLDNARYQRNDEVMGLAHDLGITLLFLPSYSPNLAPHWTL